MTQVYTPIVARMTPMRPGCFARARATQRRLIWQIDLNGAKCERSGVMGMRHVGRLVSNSPEQTFTLGRQLGCLLEAGHIVGLDGSLGAGKTCLAQGVAAGLDVDPRYRVSSPSFTLINEYPGRIALAHIDLYRLDDVEEMMEIGVFDYLGGDGACVVEWFKRCEVDQPAEGLQDYLKLDLQIAGDTARRIDIGAAGERHGQLADDWLAAVQDIRV